MSSKEQSQQDKDDFRLGGWDYAIDTPIMINGKLRTIRMEQGMTGIGSRAYWVDGKRSSRKCVLQSGDLTKGNHFIYRINWREGDTVDIVIHEDEVPFLLDKNIQPEWINPVNISDTK